MSLQTGVIKRENLENGIVAGMNMVESDSSLNKRQKVRVPVGYAVQLFLKDEEGNNLVEGKIAFIRDISFSGVGLIVPKVIFGQYHLFYEPREKAARLYLQHKNKEGERVVMELTPKWYRRGEGEESRYFYLGIEFSQDNLADDVAELINITKNTVRPKKSWLASVFTL